MNRVGIMFVLYQKKHKIYPETAAINGKIYAVNADFRNILRIFGLIGDENISENQKIKKIEEWFFESGLPGDISCDAMVEAFLDFIATTPSNAAAFATPPRRGMGTEETEERERQYCYDFDAEEIYAGFLSEYGIDLVDAEFLHWHKFRILLAHLSPESAFKRKIELRFMDLGGLDAGGRKFAELAEAKESVQLPVNNIQVQEIQEFNEIWGKAGN